jgi:hypothetical protein
MRILTALALAGVLLASASSVRSEEPVRPEEEVRLRDVDAVVREVAVTRGSGAEQWLDATVEARDGGFLRLRLAPPEILAGSGFSLSKGDAVRVRYFPGEAPYPVQRIRNHETGRVLRLRCLHGDPLWTRPGERGGPGRHGPPRDGGGGPGRGPGRRSGAPP